MSDKKDITAEGEADHPMSQRDANILKGIGVYVALALTILLAFFLPNLGTDSSQEHRIDAALKALVVAQLANCHQDHRFRTQYKIRGEVEKDFVVLFLGLARDQVQAGLDPKGTSQAFIDKFQPLAKKIRIIPVPDCKVSAEHLTTILRHTGINIPPVPFDVPGQPRP